MNDLKKALFSQEGLDKETLFEAKLNAIELKYENWFSNREDIISGKKPDRLHNYWITYQSGNNLSFKIKDELPVEIRNECLQAFADIYQKD
ncbi:hypothetical protein SAMN05421827_13128 [Pedobacter terrae]|uniref:Uncharacterized protein n=1 Tax=Pedobacter terrae TaxID=405671 RepID=A0A1G8DT14_9SPHI|nr:hypothetical protein [Pedobacter terrae]SDH60711.1 hypothetical protein SAMN05421827_13128 [Pedobacter terrae]